MATNKKQAREAEEFVSALDWSLHSLVEKVDDDLNGTLDDTSPLGWSYHYEKAASVLRAAAVIAGKLTEINKALATEGKKK